MTEVFLERSFDPPLTPDDVLAMAREATGCFGLHRVDWVTSCLGRDGRRMVCWFRGPDAEAARVALRQAGADLRVLWPGTVHDAPDAPPGRVANVLVERSFADPVTVEEIQAIEDAGAGCLENHRVKFVRTLFSLDRKRMVCLYAAPDAESVRMAQREAGVPVDRVWAFQPIGPADLRPGGA